MKLYHTPSYSRRAGKLFSPKELEAVDQMILENPQAGKVIAGTHGARKIRVAMAGRGKRGGARVIYYFWQSHEVIYLLHAYAKNQQSDLSAKDKKDMAHLIQLIERGGT